MSRKWQGTALFAVIMAGVTATVAGRMLVGSGDAAATAAAPERPSSDSSGSAGGGASAGSVTVTGSVEQTRFGPVQVSVTFSGSTITAVTTLQAPNESGRDQMLTRYATPELEKAVIASQSARVDTISGATYTSEGYLASVQSAIDAHR
jgi:uncharacterized protein with FMN-binding domain